MVILDTCAIIEMCLESPSFSHKTFKLIEAGAYVLSISFAEIACKVKMEKLKMNISPQELYLNFKQIEAFTIVPVGVEEWFESIELDWSDNKDPADRVVVAFAAKHHFTIVSTDKKMKAYYKKVIW